MTYEELILKAKAVQNSEELLALAKENGVELTEESAAAYFEQLNKKGELTDDELGNVSGGGCHHNGALVVTPLGYCSEWTCGECGSGAEWREKDINGVMLPYCKTPEKHSGKFVFKAHCCNCKYYKYEDALCLCTR